VRVYFCDQEKWSLIFHPLYLRCCRGCSLDKLSGSHVLFLREQVRDLQVQEFLRKLVVGVAAPSDLTGSILVEILHSVEGQDVEQVCSSFETILPCLWLLISLFLSYLCFISCMLILLSFLYAWYTCVLLLYDWVICLLTLVFNQESHSGTSTLNLEESWGDSSESFTRNSATLFGYTLCFSIIVLVCIINFNSALVLHLIS